MAEIVIVQDGGVLSTLRAAQITPLQSPALLKRQIDHGPALTASVCDGARWQSSLSWSHECVGLSPIASFGGTCWSTLPPFPFSISRPVRPFFCWAAVGAKECPSSPSNSLAVRAIVCDFFLFCCIPLRRDTACRLSGISAPRVPRRRHVGRSPSTGDCGARIGLAENGRFPFTIWELQLSAYNFHPPAADSSYAQATETTTGCGAAEGDNVSRIRLLVYCMGAVKRVGGAVASALAFHQSGSNSIPGGFAPGFSHVGIVLNDAASRRVFSGNSRFARPCIPAPLQPRYHFMSCSRMTGTYGSQLESPPLG
ncbi:hypothetical protein PR048_003284, partial [Dryococelus australis]